METMNTDTPETDQAERESIAAYIEAYGPDALFPCDGYDHARKLERERDELREDLEFRRGLYALQTEALEKAREERDEAREALETGGLLGILDRAGHDRAEAIRERDEARKWSATLADAGDEIRAQLREEQQLHIQTLGERDEARQWESQALVARIQRDQFSKTLGEVREILCDALPNENQLTSFMAVKLVQERDEWKAKYIQQNKDLGCELMDPNGTIWDHAKKLQAELDAARKHS